MKTWQACRPVSPKNVAANAVSLVLKPSRWYSITCVSRNVRPRSSVSTIPAQSPARLFFFTETVAQCIVKLEVTRIKRVDERQEPRPLELDVRARACTAATAPGGRRC